MSGINVTTLFSQHLGSCPKAEVSHYTNFREHECCMDSYTLLGCENLEDPLQGRAIGPLRGSGISQVWIAKVWCIEGEARPLAHRYVRCGCPRLPFNAARGLFTAMTTPSCPARELASKAKALNERSGHARLKAVIGHWQACLVAQRCNASLHRTIRIGCRGASGRGVSHQRGNGAGRLTCRHLL